MVRKMLHVEKRDGMLKVTFGVPRLNAEIAPELTRQLAEIAAKGERHFLLDFKAVETIDQAGLNVVLSLQKTVGRGGMVELTGVQGDVLKVCKLTRLDRRMAINQAA